MCPAFQPEIKIYQIIHKMLLTLPKLNFVEENIEMSASVKKELENIHFFRNISSFLTNEGLKILGNEIIESFALNCENIESDENPDYCFITSHTESLIVKKEKGLWICSCGFEKIFALPCRHLVKVLLMKEYNYIKCIDDYWKKRVQ